MKTIGEIIKSKRESKGLLLRQVASSIEIDQALLSKIERGERFATKKQIMSLAVFFYIPLSDIFPQWLGEKIANDIKDERFVNEALKIAAKKVKQNSKIKTQETHV